jgi:flagellar L-ring protein FlgH
VGMDQLLAIMPKLQRANPNLDPTKLFSMAATSDFSGQGNTARSGSLQGNIGVHVQRELPNGDLYVEGTKVVMINHEEYHLYVSGVLRPSDIQPDNSVDSSLIADARVEFTGRGDINDQVERGWLTKLLDTVNPF